MDNKSADRREAEDEYLHKIVIAAATTLAMACLKKILAMLFVEQWRSRVFLVLNIVLVAIFVTSIRSSSTEDEEINSSNNNSENTIKDQEKKRVKEIVGCIQERESEKSSIKREGKNPGLEKGEVLEQESKKCDLSKEELNEKVEAFILMFRQHLASDAKRGKVHFISKTKQAEMLNFHRLKNSSGLLKSNTVPHRHSFCI